MTDPNKPDQTRLSRRSALKTALFSTVALAAGLRPSRADPLPVPNERAMPPVGGPGPTLPPGQHGEIPVIVDTGTGSVAGGPFHLPPLPYAYDALEPFIDAETMRLHHDGHHAVYVKNLNAAYAQVPKMAALPPLTGDPLTDAGALLRSLLPAPSPPNSFGNPAFARPAPPSALVRSLLHYGGGHYNHSLLWQTMKKGGGGKPTPDLMSGIGSYSRFQDVFTMLALNHFGSGWIWLALNRSGGAYIVTSADEETALEYDSTPLLGLDVWEHAYYLKCRNRRAEYVAAWFHVVNWDFVNARYDAARKAA